MMDRLVTLLPLPLSPTMPSTSPWFTSKLMPRTAFTSPTWVKKEVFRFRTESKRLDISQTHFLSRGSRESRSPSLNRLSARMVILMMRAG